MSIAQYINTTCLGGMIWLLFCFLFASEASSCCVVLPRMALNVVFSLLPIQ